MQVNDDPYRIPSTQVAVKFNLLGEEGRRQLKHDEVWLKDSDSNEIVRMAIMNALEVNLIIDLETERPSNVSNFTWDLIYFNAEFLQLQIKFDDPEEIGAFASEDYLSVTFWGVEFFKNQFGIEVHLGH